MANRRTSGLASSASLAHPTRFNYAADGAEMQYTFAADDDPHVDYHHAAYDDGRMDMTPPSRQGGRSEPRRMPSDLEEHRGGQSISVVRSGSNATPDDVNNNNDDKNYRDDDYGDDEEEVEEEDVGDDEDSWRKPGRQFRSNLMRLDAKNSFQLRPECAIERYYQVADRVMEQFLHHPIDDRDEIIEAYLIGSRLVHFLSSILPTHPEYFSERQPLSKLRNRAQSQLSELTGYAEVLAIMIDKQEHERHLSSSDMSPPRQDEDGSSNRPNARIEGSVDARGGGAMADKYEGESLGRPRSASEANIPSYPSQRDGRSHARPPLAGRHALTSSSSSSAVPTLEIDVRTRHHGNKEDIGRKEEGRGRPSTVGSSNVARQVELDDLSASADSYLPLLMDASHRPRRSDPQHRGHRSDLRRGDPNYDWDAAWVRRHGRSNAVLDQESSVATGNTEDSSHLEPSTVDSSLMNPPEARYARLVPPSPDASSPLRTRGAVASRPYTNGENARAAYRGATSLESSSRRRDRPSPFGWRDEGAEEDVVKNPFSREEDDSLLRGETTEKENRKQAMDWERQQTARWVRDSAHTPTEAKWMQHAAAFESRPTANSGKSDRHQGAPGNRSQHSSDGRPSRHRDILEDPRQRWFGDEDSASETSIDDRRMDHGRSEDPYDEKFIADFRRDDVMDYSSASRSDSVQKQRDSKNRPDDRDQDQGVAKHNSSRRYIPGSIRERATMRRLASDVSNARGDPDPATDWVDFTGFDTNKKSSSRCVPSPQDIEFLSKEQDTPKPELQTNGSEVRLDTFPANGGRGSSIASRVRHNPVPLETSHSDHSAWNSEQPSMMDSNRHLGGIPGHHSYETKSFKVNVTVDGKECMNTSESFRLPPNDTIPNHRQSSVRASAERLKALRSRRLEFRARTPDDYRTEAFPKDAAPTDEATEKTQEMEESDFNADSLLNGKPKDSASVSLDEAMNESTPSAELQSKSQVDLNMSIENDSVLNGEVEQILTRESSMMRATYESLDSHTTMNEDVDVSSDRHDKCDGDDEASQEGASVFDPFCDDDSSAQRDLAETRKRQDVLIEAMRLEQLTFLNSTPPGIQGRGKLIPSSRDAFYKSKRNLPAPPSVKPTSSEDRRTGPVDLDATVDEEDDSHNTYDAREVGAALEQRSPEPAFRGAVAPTLASHVSTRTLIEERIDEASRMGKIVSSPTSVLHSPDEITSDSPAKIVPRTAGKRGDRAKSSAESAATSQGTFGEDDDDTAMLNAYLVRKRRPMTHFRGCVKFLLE